MRKFIRRSLVGSVVLLAIAMTALHFLSGRIVRTGIELAAPMVLGVKTSLGDVDISWLRGEISLQDLVISNPKGFDAPTLCEVKQARVKLSLPSLFSDTIDIAEISVDSPVITYERKNGTDNMTVLQENIDSNTHKSKTGKETPDGKDKKLIIRHLAIQSITARVDLGSIMSKPLSLPIPGIDLKDVGVAEGGLTPGDVAGLILESLVTGIGHAIVKIGESIGNAAPEIIDDITEAATTIIDQADETLRDASESLQQIFK